MTYKESKTKDSPSICSDGLIYLSYKRKNNGIQEVYAQNIKLTVSTVTIDELL